MMPVLLDSKALSLCELLIAAMGWGFPQLAWWDSTNQSVSCHLGPVEAGNSPIGWLIPYQIMFILIGMKL